MHPIKQYAEFVTITCLEWKHVLQDDRVKDIITASLSFLVREQRVIVYAFVIMSNHMHLIWQMVGDHKRESVQRDFLKYTSQRILKLFNEEASPMLSELLVNAKDRKYQVWKRDSLGIPIWSDSVLWQKLEYIHSNPIKAGLCTYSTDYVYSSATYYFQGASRWTFLSHVNG